MKRGWLILAGVAGLVVLAMALASNISNNAASIAQSQAAIEAARAAQISSAGLSIVATINALLTWLLALIVLGLAGLVVYLIAKPVQAPVRKSHGRRSLGGQKKPAELTLEELMRLDIMSRIAERQALGGPRSQSQIMLNEDDDVWPLLLGQGKRQG